jgi:hypothetical protein
MFDMQQHAATSATCSNILATCQQHAATFQQHTATYSNIQQHPATFQQHAGGPGSALVPGAQVARAHPATWCSVAGGGQVTGLGRF